MVRRAIPAARKSPTVRLLPGGSLVECGAPQTPLLYLRPSATRCSPLSICARAKLLETGPFQHTIVFPARSAVKFNTPRLWRVTLAK